MPPPLTALESDADRVSLAYASYRRDEVRLAVRELGDSTHIVSTRRGLFGASPAGCVQLTFGYYFGLTMRRPGEIFAFESCDLPYGPTHQGRIVRLELQHGRIVQAEVIAKGLDTGCHQIDFLRGRLHVVDTNKQQVVRFSEDLLSREILTPLPCATEGRLPKSRPDYAHVNSVLAVGDLNLLLLHNGNVLSPDRRSELAIFDLDWQPASRWTLDSSWCHGLALLEDGTLLVCGSKGGDIVSADGLRVHVSPLITRGLAVGADSIVIGGTRFGNRNERMRSSGTVTFLDRDYRRLAEIVVPTAPTEIRRLDAQDRGLSTFLESLGPAPALRLRQAPPEERPADSALAP